MRLPVAGVLLLLCACGDDLIGGVDGVVSGDRLRARYRVHEDTKIFLGFHDTQLDVDCDFAYDDDTRETARCLPEISTTIIFRDAACTEPAAQVYSPTCSAPAYLATRTTLGCERYIDRIWEVAERTTLPRVYSTINGSPCEPFEIDPAWEWYTSGAEVPLDAFVGARVELDGGSSRLRRVSFRADDGARATARVYDTGLDVECQSLTAAGGCHPFAAPESSLYEDDACSAPLASHERACGPPISYIDEYDCDDVCEPTLRALGERISATSLYRNDGNACLATPAFEGYDFYRFGPVVPPERLGSVTLTLEDPVARMSGFEHRSADGFRTRAPGLHDRQLDGVCTLRWVGDDTWRCLPEVEYTDGGPAFRDPACLEPIRVAYRESPATGLDNAVIAGGWECEEPMALYAITPQPIATLYRGSEGACVPWQIDPTVYHVVGEQLPLDSYAAFHDVME